MERAEWMRAWSTHEGEVSVRLHQGCYERARVVRVKQDPRAMKVRLERDGTTKWLHPFDVRPWEQGEGASNTGWGGEAEEEEE